MRRTFYTEAAYFIGLIMLALGTAFMERADFGMSMVVAPAYPIIAIFLSFILSALGSLRESNWELCFAP